MRDVWRWRRAAPNWSRTGVVLSMMSDFTNESWLYIRRKSTEQRILPLSPMVLRVIMGGVTSDASTIAAVAVLDDDLRRRMYAFIRRSDRPVTRERPPPASASPASWPRSISTSWSTWACCGRLRQRPVRRVGRAPKVYEPSGVDVRVSIPCHERRPRGHPDRRRAVRDGGEGAASGRPLRVAADEGGGSAATTRPGEARPPRRRTGHRSRATSWRRRLRAIPRRPCCACATARSTPWRPRLPTSSAGSTVSTWPVWSRGSARTAGWSPSWHRWPGECCVAIGPEPELSRAPTGRRLPRAP